MRLAPLPQAVDVCTPREVQICTMQAGELGGAQAGLHRECEEGVERDREHAGNDGGLLGMVQYGVAEQGMNGRQPGVAGAHRVGAVVFEVDQEPPDEGRIEIAEFQLRGCFGEVGGGEADQQLPRIAVCRDGMRAGVALLKQPVGEERLERGGEGAHAEPPGWCSRRSAANCISSGAADRYQ